MVKVQEVKCCKCGTWCQGFKTTLGTYCRDCFVKTFGIPPEKADGGLLKQ